MARTTLRRTTPPPGSSTFCYWVKRWRAYQGVTQREFAELWGVSPSLVQKIEADDYSVSQLSFERLETLRALLQLPSGAFYGLIATYPDKATEHSNDDPVQVERLEPGLPPVSVPQTLLGSLSSAALCAFAVALSDFSSESLRHRLNTGTLIIFNKAQTPQENDVGVALTQHAGQTCRVLLSDTLGSSELHRFGPENGAVMRPQPDGLEPIGVVVAYWVKLA